MKVYLVMVDAAGHHEADCLYSVWDNKEDADKEADRLNNSGKSLGSYGGRAGVQEIELNKQYSEMIELPYYY